MNSYTGPLSVLEIDLGAVARNYLFLAKKTKRGADCGAVVKSDAYGLGISAISKTLYDQNCRHFFVATFEEGVEVRNALASFPLSPRTSRVGEGRGEGGADVNANFEIRTQPNHPPHPNPLPPASAGGEGTAAVYVLHGPRGATPEDFAAQNLIPVLNTLPDIDYWSAFAKKSGKKQPAVLHIDTGMNRLGLNATDKLTPELLKPLDIRYVMSHLACADDPAHPKNREQLELFKKLTAETGMAFRYSLANSGGILLGPDYHFDLARPGCGLYGINPQPRATSLMQNVVTLRARILQVRHVDRPSTVGYGASYPVVPGTICATIAAGYADGYLRSLSNAGAVVINGEKCPVIGRVSMDSIVADVTALKGEPGEWAEIIAAQQSIDEVAAQAGTIGYEMLTSLGKRYKRTYT